MLSPSTASIESERFVIVGTIKKLDFCKASPGEETEEGVCFQWVLKIVSATVYGFLRGGRGKEKVGDTV